MQYYLYVVLSILYIDVLVPSLAVGLPTTSVFLGCCWTSCICHPPIADTQKFKRIYLLSETGDPDKPFIGRQYRNVSKVDLQHILTASGASCLVPVDDLGKDRNNNSDMSAIEYQPLSEVELEEGGQYVLVRDDVKVRITRQAFFVHLAHHVPIY